MRAKPWQLQIRRGDAREEEILDAAESVFRQKGYHRASTGEIAQNAGFSVEAMPGLFSDKEDLYARVLERIGRRLMGRLENHVLCIRDTEAAIQALIRVRLYNYRDDRLFFQPFSCDGDLGVPDISRLPKRVQSLYREYFDAVTKLFSRAVDWDQFENLTPRDLTISLEGILNAFMSYWSGPGQSDHQDLIAKRISHMLFTSVGLKRAPGVVAPPHTGGSGGREIYISRFDRDRLKELIVVARCFDTHERKNYLDSLDSELDRALIVSPKEVPPDLVTMNSRVLLRDAGTGESLPCVLAFPKDFDHISEAVSILEPLGTFLLGSRLGDVLEVERGGRKVSYKVEQILYQPESAGDYHL
jgi:regulator of nucleoside diphosphate kinase